MESTAVFSRPAPAATRPKVNSILHLFGPWLFEASLIACESPKIGKDVLMYGIQILVSSEYFPRLT